MLLLQFLELIINDFNLWPTNVLLAIFVDQLTDQSIETIAAFSYGNGIPLRLLTRFVTLCNRLWTHNSSLQLYTLYHLWKVEAYTLHHATYYDVGRKELCWINGDNHPQHEPTTNGEEAAAAGITLGFECTEHDEVIIAKLNELQDEEFMFDLFH